MSERAARALVVIALAVAAACGGGEKRVVDNYFNAVKAGDNQTVSSFAAVDFREPVQSWKVKATRDEEPVPATLPQLSSKMKELEMEAAAAKKRWDGYKLQHYAELTKVDDLKRKGSPVPAALAPAASEWDTYNEKSRELKKQIAAAKQELDRERRSARLSVGDLEDLESLQGEVHTKQVDVEVTGNGQTKPYVMTLRKYELKRDQGPRPMSRWIIQDLKPKT